MVGRAKRHHALASSSDRSPRSAGSSASAEDSRALDLGLPRHRHGVANRTRTPPSQLLFMSSADDTRPGIGLAVGGAPAAAMPALIADLALELAPVRVNVIAAGFVDTSVSAPLLGDQLDARRDQLRATLPIGRVVGPADVAALAVRLITNTALTGATYAVDGGQRLV
jgi:NAD(P)-dependent dehydrogenase (short-subunit alcohol dehydrogenase family)